MATDVARLRSIASAVVPARAKRALDRVRRRWFLAAIRAPTREYLRRNGLRVLRGPFAGMRYETGLDCAAGDLVAKLSGGYEAPLYAVADEWIAAGFDLIVDVGCAEGFYAVGFAYATTGVGVIAYDIDPGAREQCARMARANDVCERVAIRGACTHASLAAMPVEGVALLCDCEGYEQVLLDPERAPVLRGWTILVELHEFAAPAITETIRARFEATHEIELIASDEPCPSPPELDFMTARQRARILSERPVRMYWAHLRPRV